MKTIYLKIITRRIAITRVALTPIPTARFILLFNVPPPLNFLQILKLYFNLFTVFIHRFISKENNLVTCNRIVN